MTQSILMFAPAGPNSPVTLVPDGLQEELYFHYQGALQSLF